MTSLAVSSGLLSLTSDSLTVTTTYPKYSGSVTDSPNFSGTCGYKTSSTGYGTIVNSDNPNTDEYSVTSKSRKSSKSSDSVDNFTITDNNTLYEVTFSQGYSKNTVNITNITITNDSSFPTSCNLTISQPSSQTVYNFVYDNDKTNTVTYAESVYSFSENNLSYVYFETLILGINGIYDYVVGSDSSNAAPINEYAGFVDLSMTGLQN